MKAILRRNGKMMFSINVIQRVGLYDIREAILSEQGYNQDGSFEPFKEFKGRKKVMEIVKIHLTYYGCEIDYSTDDDIRDEFEVESLENALRLFPELKE